MRTGYRVHLAGFSGEFTRKITARLSSRGLSVVEHQESEDLFALTYDCDAACLITHLSSDHRDSVKLLRGLALRPDAPSVIFVTDRPDVQGAVQAMKEGAFEVMEKPIDMPLLYETVKEALARNSEMRSRSYELLSLQERFERLTKREREVLPLVLGGWLIKQTAAVLGVADITVQLHRSQIMRKMQAESLADLVRMGIKLGIRYTRSIDPGDSGRWAESIHPPSCAIPVPGTGRRAVAAA